YYNGKLNIKSSSVCEQPLVYMDMEGNRADYKNTSPLEAESIIEYVKKNRDKKIGVITPFANQNRYINGLLKENGLTDVTCGTVHAFQGDEKDVILFSLAVTEQTGTGTYEWLKCNKELINVATSRAKDRLIILSSSKNLDRLHKKDGDDDIYELVEYVKTKGTSAVTGRAAASRALGVKPYSTETEEAFLRSLNFALDNILYNNRKCTVHKEVSIAHVFQENTIHNDLFYSGRFDFVVYERTFGKQEIPILAIELDGKEHVENEVVRERDRKKSEICRQHGFELIRIENSYARRYNYIKSILTDYFIV
ncbi:MAG TPA: AAA domain-containing protein, partial [Clostridia bacterium]|nr:AAA domain-containing protein [Clostridia bacterium]